LNKVCIKINKNIILDDENIENKDVFILLQNENIKLDNENIENSSQSLAIDSR
jgi:hypothetical protein